MNENNNRQRFGPEQIPTITDGMCCIDTYRIFDSCRKKEFLQSQRIYFTEEDQTILNRSLDSRIKSVKIVWAQIQSSDLPYNSGYYQVDIRYYFNCELEICQGLGNTTTISGLCIHDTSVVLYGGETDITSFKSSSSRSFCNIQSGCFSIGTSPTVAVEVANPIPLRLSVEECIGCNELGINENLPDEVRSFFSAPLNCVMIEKAAFIDIGLFSLIRMERPSQIVVPACDFCIPGENQNTINTNDNSSSLFEEMKFPFKEFYPDSK